MKTLILKKSDFKETGNYYKEYVGKKDLNGFDGNLEIETNLGWLRIKGSITISRNFLITTLSI